MSVQSPRSAGRVMMSAHSLCPTDLSHPDKMQWMAAYFLANYSPAGQDWIDVEPFFNALAAPTPAQPTPEPSQAEFILHMLVAAGHVTQAKVDEAYAIAAKMPAAPALPAEPVAVADWRPKSFRDRWITNAAQPVAQGSRGASSSTTVVGESQFVPN